MTSRAEQALRDLVVPGAPKGIINGYDVLKVADQAGLTPITISYSPEQRGRMYRSPQWSVHHLREKTNPGGHWMDYGNKVFGLFQINGTLKEKRQAARDEAIAWTNEKYGTTEEWVPVPGLRNYLFQKSVVDHVKGLLKMKEK